MLISEAIAQTATGAATPPGFLDTFWIFPVMIVAMYFLMIRPQQKKTKEHQKMMTQLQKGDEVVTSGGMAGRISKVGENYLTLSVAEAKDGAVDVIVQKSAVTTLLPKGTLKTL